MSSKTSTETRREITKRGNVVIIKEVEKTTTYAPGKDPEVKEVTRVEEFEGEEGYKRLPEEIRRQLEGPDRQEPTKAINKNAVRGNFPQDCLSEHNKYRNRHSVEPLTLSQKLIQISETRAKELATKDEMNTREDHEYGENMSVLWSSDPDHYVDATEIVGRWYSEEKNYNYDKEPDNLNAGHFTQMIWAGCREFGIAAAKSNSNRIYVVATYSPPGNFLGEFKKNVRPPGSKPNEVTSTASGKFVPATISRMTSGPSTPAIKANTGNSIDPSSISDLNKECVKCHNEYRSKHGVPPLVYSKEVATYAQQWADELARQDKFEHRKERKYGENLYCFKSTDPKALATPADACNSWYSEIQHYDFNSEPKSLSTGHFTQMVWKSTSEVGMGRAKSKSGLQIIVANYNPPGNFIGSYRANIPRPIQ